MSKYVKYLAIVALSVLFLAVGSCDDDPFNSPRDTVFPDSSISYIHHVQKFLDLKCGYAGCHNDYYMAGGRSMDDYMDLFDGANLGLVIPYKPENSRLWQIAENENLHLPEFPENYITENEADGIYQWILEGAEFN